MYIHNDMHVNVMNIGLGKMRRKKKKNKKEEDSPQQPVSPDAAGSDLSNPPGRNGMS